MTAGMTADDLPGAFASLPSAWRAVLPIGPGRRLLGGRDGAGGHHARQHDALAGGGALRVGGRVGG